MWYVEGRGEGEGVGICRYVVGGLGAFLWTGRGEGFG